jgi:hypothetical protein
MQSVKNKKTNAMNALIYRTQNRSSEMTTQLGEIISTHFETQINSLIESLKTYFPEEAIGDNIVRLRGIVEKSYALADEKKRPGSITGITVQQDKCVYETFRDGAICRIRW